MYDFGGVDPPHGFGSCCSTLGSMVSGVLEDLCSVVLSIMRTFTRGAKMGLIIYFGVAKMAIEPENSTKISNLYLEWLLQGTSRRRSPIDFFLCAKVTSIIDRNINQLFFVGSLTTHKYRIL